MTYYIVNNRTLCVIGRADKQAVGWAGDCFHRLGLLTQSWQNPAWSSPRNPALQCDPLRPANGLKMKRNRRRGHTHVCLPWTTTAVAVNHSLRTRDRPPEPRPDHASFVALLALRPLVMTDRCIALCKYFINTSQAREVYNR